MFGRRRRKSKGETGINGEMGRRSIEKIFFHRSEFWRKVRKHDRIRFLLKRKKEGIVNRCVVNIYRKISEINEVVGFPRLDR